MTEAMSMIEERIPPRFLFFFGSLGPAAAISLHTPLANAHSHRPRPSPGRFFGKAQWRAAASSVWYRRSFPPGAFCKPFPSPSPPHPGRAP